MLFFDNIDNFSFKVTVMQCNAVSPFPNLTPKYLHNAFYYTVQDGCTLFKQVLVYRKVRLVLRRIELGSV